VSVNLEQDSGVCQEKKWIFAKGQDLSQRTWTQVTSGKVAFGDRP